MATSIALIILGLVLLTVGAEGLVRAGSSLALRMGVPPFVVDLTIVVVEGIMLPALLHFSFNRGLPSHPGIGIPMATDIAFALSVLALVGSRVPASLKVFLTAVAVLDDLCSQLSLSRFFIHPNCRSSL